MPLEQICTNRLQILRTATREERERGASWSLSIERSKNIDADLKTQTKDNYVRKHVHELDRLILEFAMIQG